MILNVTAISNNIISLDAIFLSFQFMKGVKNIVGAKVRKFRKSLGLTQDTLASKLQIEGLVEMTRFGVSKIENQTRTITDYELRILAKVLKVSTDELYPSYKLIAENIEEIRRPLKSFD